MLEFFRSGPWNTGLPPSTLSSCKAHSAGIYSCFLYPLWILAFIPVLFGVESLEGNFKVPFWHHLSVTSSLLSSRPHPLSHGHQSFQPEQVRGSQWQSMTPLPPQPSNLIQCFTKATTALPVGLPRSVRLPTNLQETHPLWDGEESRKQMATPFQAWS